MSEDKIVLARVKGNRPAFINGVLNLPGELVRVNLTELGIEDLDNSEAFEAVDEGTREAIATQPVASVAPRAPGATAPQGAPPGSRESGTGRMISPTSGGNAVAVELVPDLGASELEPEAPIRRDSDIQPISDGDGDGEEGDENPEIDALVRGNNKTQLLELAAGEGVENVSADNNKAEIAAKIVAKRSAG